jgi:hypothetical protein
LFVSVFAMAHSASRLFVPAGRAAFGGSTRETGAKNQGPAVVEARMVALFR